MPTRSRQRFCGKGPAGSGSTRAASDPSLMLFLAIPVTMLAPLPAEPERRCAAMQARAAELQTEDRGTGTTMGDALERVQAVQ